MKGTEGKSAGKQTVFHTLHRFRALLLALSIIVVFITTYLLILPALTLEKDTAKKQGGIDVETNTYEAGILTYEGKGFDVEASFKENAKLPEGARIDVQEIDEKSDQYNVYREKALEAVQEHSGKEDTKLSFAKFYDIALTADGSEVELKDAVDVKISYDDGVSTKDADHISIIHFRKDAQTGKVQADVLKHSNTDITIKKDRLTEAAFKADSFSVYALVCTISDDEVADNTDSTDKDNSEENGADESEEKKDEIDKEEQENELSASGKTYEVTVKYGEDAQIPEGATLRVTQIDTDDEEYAKIQKDIKKNLKKGKDEIPANPVLFDISIYKNGKKVEPAKDSQVQVDVKLTGALKGMYSDESSPLLINDKPVTDKKATMKKQMQILHLKDDDKIDVVETEDKITEKKAVSSFKTDSFSNWLMYLDEDLTKINVTTGDSITLRPYTEWVWKKTDEPSTPIDYSDGQWTFPSSDWDSRQQTENNVTYTYYTHKTNGSVFRSFEKKDSQLNETYTVVTSVSLGTGNDGKFNLTTNKGKTIEVHVTEGQSSGKPATVTGVSGLTVNLFDYDVPYKNGVPDFTQSGNLDVETNVASDPDNENNINTNHDLKFLGYGGSNVGDDNNWFWINNYTKDIPQQGIVKNHLINDYPSLAPGKDGQERGNPSLEYLFDTTSHNSNVYAFPNADGLFQKDNQGYYYYNSNSNYAEYDQSNNKFTLYEHTYSQNTGGSNGANAKPIGFYPFHEFDTVDTQPQMNFNKNLNHHFGMSMTVDFEIPQDRKMEDESGNKHDIIYEFSGDDDLWVFVDDELVLDIGGIHQPVTGKINFTTGQITVHGVGDITKTFDVGAHTLKMFYIERGGCDSNLSVKFNLPLTKGKSQIDIIKKSMTDDATNPDTVLEGAIFGIWESADCFGDPYMTATSSADGHLEFNNLPIKEPGQTYYLKEISPPSGYLLNTNIYTLTVNEPDSDGEYSFTISLNGTEIEKAEDTPVIRNGRPDPINLTVEKQWQNEDGTEMISVPADVTALFEVRRYVTKVKVIPEAETVSVIIRDNENKRFDQTYAHVGDILQISYTHSPDSNGTTASCSAGNGVQSILSMPTNNTGAPISVEYTVNQSHVDSNGTIEIICPNWFTDWCNGSNYSAGVNPHFTGNSGGSGGGSSIETETYLDPTYSQPINLPYNESWTYTAHNLQTLFTDEDYQYFYEYFITEKNVPEGFEAIYLDGSGNPIIDPSKLKTNTGGSQTVVNRKLLDVPIEKEWTDFSGTAYTWQATFQLEEMEVKVNENQPDAHDAITDRFVAVEGRTPLTIEKGQHPVPTFDNLPMYRVHNNGTIYRIQYSVDEIAYTVKRNGTVVAQWSKDGSLEVVGDTRYEPQFEQDAGEHGSSVDDYVIRIVNVMENRRLVNEIDLDLQKTWPEGSSYADKDDTFASFVLKRYVHEEYRDYHSVPVDAEWVTVTLKTWSDDSKNQTVTVPRGTSVHIVGSILPNTNANKIRFNQDSGQSDLELIQNNTQNSQMPFDITVTADQSKHIILAQGDNYVAGGRDGFRLTDYGTRNPDREDESFEESFTLNKANNWKTTFAYLPQVEEQSIDPTTGAQTIYVYSYYFEETACNPADFHPVFRDQNDIAIGGGSDNRIEYSTSLKAENKRVEIDIILKKVAADQLDIENPPTLQDAAFRIEKYTSSSYQDKDTAWGVNGEMSLTDVDHNGLFSLEGLYVGYYKIVETACPEGYSKLTDDPLFEIRQNDITGEMQIILLNPDKTEAEDNQLEMVRVNDLTILFGNEPGVELPYTGGSGTIWLYVLGALLVVLSGTGFVLKKRKDIA